ncbi:MAG: SAM-dependent methyltransferase [Candidatus Handelsmanbacteria bacterium RIFCSPLOWO2_12_FULL_64_10]|uniref:SAM-dependent methyltransferase n=1 Tax=Handelsmanbacteria sp. (strain RIFCSPLOWO2_12_FULL_64_10) TaxID=1817868 RepID=A0A1F6C5D3_HANXR|nr:MAG: SAM-dependent methyltransferase [Candidatus Handelsmanbacteria bacterium RIFCSPLOWO2_12_FULL_64_10]
MSKGPGRRGHLCPSCGAAGVSIFYEVEQVPAHSVLLMPTQTAALDYPRGDVVLGFCRGCGFISNVAFNPEMSEYSSRYEETQGFSPTFNAFHRGLAGRLIERHDLHGKEIVEIGCGKGEFLTLLCELGGNRGVGFDPAYVSERNRSEARDQITFIKDFYSEKYAHHRGDFICCKMTLEHIPRPAELVSVLRRSIGDRRDTVLFFQVPDVTRILREGAFWDIYYEHCSYFSPGSLARLFRRCGFDIIAIERDYGGQYLMIEGRPGDGASSGVQEDDLEALACDVAHFFRDARRQLDTWRRTLRRLSQDGRRAVLWGSGSKGVAFLTALGVRDEIAYAVDINPYRNGTYMAGTGQKIVSPCFLREYRPDVVIAMNPMYREEILWDLRQMGLSSEVITV